MSARSVRTASSTDCADSSASQCASVSAPIRIIAFSAMAHSVTDSRARIWPRWAHCSGVGAGGAFISVPFMTWCNVKIHDAVGTSAALGFPIALAGTLGYMWAGRGLPQMPPGSLGYIYLPGLIVVSAASMSLAPLGARTAHRMDIQPMRKLFGVFLYLLAGYFLLR